MQRLAKSFRTTSRTDRRCSGNVCKQKNEKAEKDVNIRKESAGTVNCVIQGRSKTNAEVATAKADACRQGSVVRSERYGKGETGSAYTPVRVKCPGRWNQRKGIKVFPIVVTLRF